MLKEEYIRPETEIILLDNSISTVTTSTPIDDDPDNAGIILAGNNP